MTPIKCPFCGCNSMAMQEGAEWAVYCNNDGTWGDDGPTPCCAAGPKRATEAEAIAAWNTRKSEALADDAVEHVLAHVAGGGPHEWGYRDPVTGEFIADDWPFRAADALAAVRSTPPEADLRAVDLLREVEDAMAQALAKDDVRPLIGPYARLGAALKEAK